MPNINLREKWFSSFVAQELESPWVQLRSLKWLSLKDLTTTKSNRHRYGTLIYLTVAFLTYYVKNVCYDSPTPTTIDSAGKFDGRYTWFGLFSILGYFSIFWALKKNKKKLIWLLEYFSIEFTQRTVFWYFSFFSKKQGNRWQFSKRYSAWV